MTDDYPDGGLPHVAQQAEDIRRVRDQLSQLRLMSPERVDGIARVEAAIEALEEMYFPRAHEVFELLQIPVLDDTGVVRCGQSIDPPVVPGFDPAHLAPVEPPDVGPAERQNGPLVGPGIGPVTSVTPAVPLAAGLPIEPGSRMCAPPSQGVRASARRFRLAVRRLLAHLPFRSPQ